MYETIVSVIGSGSYDLPDIIKKIRSSWIYGDFDEETMESLIKMAQENAKPEQSLDNFENQVQLLSDKLRSLEKRVEELESKGSGTGSDHSSEDISSVKDWKQPTGVADSYRKDDLMRYTDGKIYKCLADWIVWSPEFYPQGWELVE